MTERISVHCNYLFLSLLPPMLFSWHDYLLKILHRHINLFIITHSAVALYVIFLNIAHYFA